MKKIDFMITAFRDGFQSVFGARVFTKDFLPAVEAARDAGITHFEAGGGARFQSLYFYCNEDAFEMMDAFRQAAGPDADLQTLARGTNVVGLESQPRGIIDLHAKMFAKHGITTIRNFDALNDVNNLIYSGQCIVNAGLNHEVCVTMMQLPPEAMVPEGGAHSPEFYIETLKKILDAGIPYDSVCFKDASGTSLPSKVFDTIKLARKVLGPDKRIVFHTHETAGTSIISYKAAIEAGADQVDLSMAPVSGGTCQPDVVTMWHALRGTDYDLGVDIRKVTKAEDEFKRCMADYFMPPEAKAVEPLIPFSPMPGGALTANTQMMRDNGIFEKYDEVAAAMGEVVIKGGFGTSVTPVSQFYFQQAFNNVMIGPWTKIAEGYGKMVLGYFGKTPVAPDPEIVKLAEKQLGLPPTDEIPVDINDKDPAKGTAPAKKLLEEAGLPITDENVFIAATCKAKGIAFLKSEASVGVRKKVKSDNTGEVRNAYTVTLNGKNYAVKLEDGKAVVNGRTYEVDVAEGIEDRIVESPASSADSSSSTVEAPLAGLVLKIDVSEGEEVSEGDVVMVLEALKMEQPITSGVTGIVQSVLVEQNQQVKSGQALIEIV